MLWGKHEALSRGSENIGEANHGIGLLDPRLRGGVGRYGLKVKKRNVFMVLKKPLKDYGYSLLLACTALG